MIFPKYQESSISGLSRPMYKKMQKHFLFFIVSFNTTSDCQVFSQKHYFQQMFDLLTKVDENRVDVLVSLNIIEIIMKCDYHI